MKHNTKRTKRATVRASSAAKRMIALRIPVDEMPAIEQMAEADNRSLSQFALICFRLGLAKHQSSDKEV